MMDDAREIATRLLVERGREAEPLEVARLVAALESLRPLDRAVFLAFRFERLRYDEIGRRFGLSRRRVKRRLAEALFVLVTYPRYHRRRWWRWW